MIDMPVFIYLWSLFFKLNIVSNMQIVKGNTEMVYISYLIQ